MGGHKAGEIASNMAVEIISSNLEKDLVELNLNDNDIIRHNKMFHKQS